MLTALRRVNDPQEAEDLTSLIFTRALTSLDQYRGGLVAAWLFRIAHNTIINYRKSSRRDVPLTPNEAAHAIGLLEQVIRSEEDQMLRKLVDKLPPDQRNLLLLKVISGLASHEIGKIVGKRAGSVRVAIHRILRQLNVAYRQSQGNEGKPDDD